MFQKALQTVAVAVFLVISFLSPKHAQAELPVLRTGFIFTTHHIPLMVACAQGEKFKDLGVWLRPVEPRSACELMQGDTPVALLDLVS